MLDGQFCRINEDEYLNGVDSIQIDDDTFKYFVNYDLPHGSTICRFEDEETSTEDEQTFRVSQTFFGNVNFNEAKIQKNIHLVKNE